MINAYDFHYWWNEDIEMITIVNYGIDYAARYQNFQRDIVHDLETKYFKEVLEFCKGFTKNNFEDFLNRLLNCSELSLEEYLILLKIKNESH